MTKLSELALNKSALIKKIDIENKIRFYDLGIIEGEIIKFVLTSFFSDPKAYQVNGSVFAIRKEDSDLIDIETLDE